MTDDTLKVMAIAGAVLLTLYAVSRAGLGRAAPSGCPATRVSCAEVLNAST